MVEKMSVRKRIAFVIVPLVLSVLLSTFFILRGNWVNWNQAKGLVKAGQFFLDASSVIHEVQKERGRSAVYLNGKGSIQDLEQQRALADKAFENVRKSLLAVAFTPKQHEEIIALLDEHAKNRVAVDSKIPAAESNKNFGGWIDRLIRIQSQLPNIYHLDGLETKFLSLVILEQAKESMGKLRAGTNAVIASDQPIPSQTVSVLESFKAGITANLSSAGLSIHETRRAKIQEIFDSENWKHVVHVYSKVVQHAATGGYGEESKKFFDAITACIDSAKNIVSAEIDDLNVTLDRTETQARTAFLAILGSLIFGLFIIIGFCMTVVRSILKGLQIVGAGLTAGSQRVGNVATEISAAGTALSDSSNEQASAIQETVASMEEIRAMISKSSEGANRAVEVVQTGSENVEKGKEAVTQVMNSMEQIRHANGAIIQQVTRNSEQLADVVRVISEIGQKTKVINDIVFQTKLLSFNASVEAARAGEQGKGFAVVAEEIGKLAQVSGNAAQEISSMLENGVRAVEQIVQSSKSSVEGLAEDGRKRIESGVGVTKVCGDLFNEIVGNVNEIKQVAQSISSATQEQSHGIEEISKAMQQLDITTQQNVSTAQKSAQLSSDLDHESRQLNEVVLLLQNMLDGGGASMTPVESVAHRKSEASDDEATVQEKEPQNKAA